MFSNWSSCVLLVSPHSPVPKQAHYGIWRLYRAAQFEFESDLTLEGRNSLTIYVKTRCVAFKCVFICYFTPKRRYLIDVRYQQRLHVPSTCQEISADLSQRTFCRPGFLPLTGSHYVPSSSRASDKQNVQFGAGWSGISYLHLIGLFYFQNITTQLLPTSIGARLSLPFLSLLVPNHHPIPLSPHLSFLPPPLNAEPAR